MIKAFRFRLYPTSKQADRLSQMLRDHCELYNAALEERQVAYAKRKTRIGYVGQALQLKEIRSVRADQARWSFSSQQQTLRRLDKAFAGFFRRVKAGGKPGFPRFRSIGRFDSVDHRHDNGAKYFDEGCSPGHARLRLLGVGVIKVRQHRNLPPNAKLGQLTVKRVGLGRREQWYVIIPVHTEAAPLPKTGQIVGLDLGVSALLTSSEPVPMLTDDQGHAANSRFGYVSADRIADAQRAVARCTRGSRRRKKACERVRILHGKVARRRLDAAHKAALALVRHADVIVMEDLRAANMVRRPAPQPNGDGTFAPNGAAQKSGLNKAIHDAGWGVLVNCILAKAEEAGREIVFVNPANTSRRCARCGHTAKENRVSQSEFRCQACGHEANADRNAALNILRAGTAHRDAQAA